MINAGRRTLERFVDLTSHGPQRLFGIAGKGRIAAGYDADFTIVDMKKKAVLTAKDMHSKTGFTSWEGMEVRGVPVYTIVRGQIIMENGKIVLESDANDLQQNPDVKEFYLGVTGPERKSFRNVKAYKRRKRWLA